jgi:hypothetical protein
VRGRVWLILGAVLGIAVAIGHLPYLAGAGRSLADTAQRLVGSGGNDLVRWLASRGAPRRVVEGLAGLFTAIVPGVTAWLLVVAARGSLRLRALVALVLVVVGAASYIYQDHGHAAGVLLLTVIVGGLAVALTGPLVAAPLTGLAALIGATFLPDLLRGGHRVTQLSCNDLHLAFYGTAGTPDWLRVVVLVVAAVPFFFAARLVLWR